MMSMTMNLGSSLLYLTMYQVSLFNHVSPFNKDDSKLIVMSHYYDATNGGETDTIL